MVGQIEKVLGERIERRQLPGFDYGGYVPDGRAGQGRPSPSQPSRKNGQSNRYRGNRSRARSVAAGG